MTTTTPAPSWLLPLLMSFVAAYVDAVGFVALYGLFTAHVTGNFILIGATLVHAGYGDAGGSSLATKLLALPMFALVVAVTTLAIRRREAASRGIALPLVVAQALLIAGFMLAGWHAAPIVDADAPWPMAAGMFGVAAMAVQNAASRTVFAKLAPTTVMTGNVTQVVIDAVDLARGHAMADRAATRARAARMLPPVVAFAVGAVCGALAFRAIGFACLVATLLALGGVAAIVARESA